MSENLLDAHTFSLDFQGNIYTVTSIQQSGTFTTKVETERDLRSDLSFTLFSAVDRCDAHPESVQR